MKRYTDEFKKEVVKLYSSGAYTVDSLAAEYGICRSTVVLWNQNYHRELLARDAAKHERVLKKIIKLQQENTKLKEENVELKEKNDVLTKTVKNLCNEI